MSLYKKCTTKPYAFLVIDTTLATDNKMKTYKMILTKKQQKNLHYRLKKMINMNILKVKKIYILIEAK